MTTFCLNKSAASGLVLLLSSVCVAQKDALLMMDATRIGEKDQLWIDIRKTKNKPFHFIGETNYTSTAEMEAEEVFALKNGSTNIYLEWLNPISYTIEWTDSLVDDPFDQAVSDFAKLLLAQFQLDAELSKFAAEFQQAGTPAGGRKAKETYKFKDVDLVVWRILIEARLADDFNNDVFLVLSDKLQAVDKLLPEEYGERISNAFEKLSEISAVNDVVNSTGTFKAVLDTIGRIANDTTALNKALTVLEVHDVSAIQMLDPEAYNMTLQVIKTYCTKMRSKLKATGAALKSLDLLVNKLKASVEAEDVKEVNKVQYHRARRVNIPRGKVLRSTLTITKNVLDKSTITLTKDKAALSVKMQFYRMRAFVPSASTGFAYTPLTLRSFGTGTDSTGATIVQEVNKQGGTPVVSLMLNWYVNTGQNDIVPILQVGLDPTKERPFILAGGGVYFPLLRFALSVGAICAFDQKLKDLNPGDKVGGTAEIKEQTTYRFNSKPEWYMGLQYNINF